MKLGEFDVGSCKVTDLLFMIERGESRLNDF